MITNGRSRRLTGLLTKRRRGYVLTCENGDVWIITLAEGIHAPRSDRVLLEGVQTGQNLMTVDWIADVIPNAR